VDEMHLATRKTGVRNVSGHGFSRADRAPAIRGFSRCCFPVREVHASRRTAQTRRVICPHPPVCI
jgi:hypothetical protein